MQESKSSKLFLISSLILGLVAAVVSYAYLANATNADNGPKVTIIVAKHELRQGTQLNPDRDFMELEIPKQLAALQSRCLTPAIAVNFKNYRVNRNILPGTPIMMADLGVMGDLAIAGDKRALSIPAKGAQVLSRLLDPGDLVKLLVTVPIIKVGAGPGGSTGPTGQWESTPVLEDPVRVLAVGSRLTKSRAQISLSDAYQGASDNDQNQTVTLEVTEAQAKTILEKTGAGSLQVTLILCPPEKGKEKGGEN